MVLGIDYGRKRIGLAISDETETIAMAIAPIIFRNETQTFTDLENVIKKYNVSNIVLGAPLGIDDKPTQMSEEILEFRDELLSKVNVKISLWNEVFTSHIAKKNLNKDTRSGKLDSESARIILQEYLDFRKEVSSKK